MSKTLGLEAGIYHYLLSVSVSEPDVLKQLREETNRYPNARMQTTPDQGQFLALLVRILGAKKTLDIGVFTGYSSLWVALALPAAGKIIACDVSQEYTDVARRYWEQADVANKIDLRIAPALDTLDKLLALGEAQTFDFAFIDADKVNYEAYYERALQLIRPGGLIAVDNTLWGGRVADAQNQSPSTQTIRAFNKKIFQDKRVFASMVAIADGLTLALKK